ncbi:MAG: lysophospholipid acyltransferase family protein [Prolixibacteraceae bacterium]|jgi:KDO2-lipid IV(A) lauroyltransferase|nr:lysophospholipid acyltransferase family protein [Prolixibacteraceae bacterium]
MKKSIGYYILMALTWPMQLFPLRFHYVISNCLYLVVYHVFGYRKAVVTENLRNSFPEKNEHELKLIEKKFYHHFVDMFVETLYLTHITKKEHSKRLVYENMELIDDLYAQKKSVICITAHYGNWEFTSLLGVHLKHRLYAIYKKLNNKMFDRFYKDIRGKEGAILLEMRQTFKQLVLDSKNGELFFAGLIADQRPLKNEIQFWMPFLNQDTPMIVGPEKIAKKINAAVVWTELELVKRGYYKLVFKLITDDPKSTQEHEITKVSMKYLEDAIIRCPELWLWSHKRWKHKRENTSK